MRCLLKVCPLLRYDKNRERILQGGFGRSDEYEEERLDVFQFFTASCYSGYGDDPGGFFAVYRDLFTELADEEKRASVDPPEIDPPLFGCAESDFDEVVHPFYEYWEAFSSCKTYAWKDAHDSSQAPNRFVSSVKCRDVCCWF